MEKWRTHQFCSFVGYVTERGKSWAHIKVEGEDYWLTKDELERRRVHLVWMGWRHNVTTAALQNWPEPKIKVVMTRKRRD